LRRAAVKRALGAGKRPRVGRAELQPRPLAAALGCATLDSVVFRCAVARLWPHARSMGS